MRKHLVVILSLVSSLWLSQAQATHLRAGEITAVRTSCTSLTFAVTITVFLDTESGVPFGGSWLDFGDNGKNSRVFIDEMRTTPRPDLGRNMGMATITKVYTYTGAGTYTISYSEEFRNEDIKNMDNSGATKFYLETTVIIDPGMSCNQNLPVLLIPPIDKACTGVAFFHNPGAVDLDGDSLSFELVTPEQASNMSVWNYKQPVDAKFYLNYEAGNEEKKGRPTFTINPFDGNIKWDAPGMVGEYNIAFDVIEWRRDANGVFRKMSITRRDMQVVVDDCNNMRPDLILPNDTCVVAGTTLKNIIYGIDPENDPVKIEVFSEVLNLPQSPASYKPYPPVFQSSYPQASLAFEWNTTCEHVKEQYYHVVFKITDKPATGPNLVTFKTWRIKVVAPAPLWDDVTVDLAKRTATLHWKDYTCSNATRMQVWRKIDGSSYEPSYCETGMPENLGYDLLGTVLLKDSLTQQPVNYFLDNNKNKGLAPGAEYCYRIVAIFPNPKGGESYVSKDTCLIPIRADAPVITNVTVESTDQIQGAVRISWRSPFEIDRTQYPGPFRYEVYRAEGIEGTDAVLVSPQDGIPDTTFVDEGLNTKDNVYNYRIVIYSNTANDLTSYAPVDTSAIASSVRLNAGPFPDHIQLSWAATVPWLNASERFPYHLIYRGEEGQAQETFALIDSAFVINNRFVYRDEGKYQSTPLDKNKTYCYRILTRGTYGNSDIQEPLENFSQLICVKPDEDGKPCAPVLTLTAVDCEQLFATSQCSVNEFTNRMSWQTDCSEQVSFYRVYASAGPERDFVLIADNVRDNFFIDVNLPSFARCYKVTSVDALGVESDASEIVCNDNCPYFELPNIFSPNGDGCNDYFSAFGPFNPLMQSAPEYCSMGEANYTRCLRFVKRVTVKIFNRWGKEVYTYKGGDSENSVYVNWDGHANNGDILATGVYYYQALVTFDTIDPAKQEQTIKGWVHLLR